MLKRLKGLITLVVLLALAALALAWFTGYVSFGNADPPDLNISSSGPHHTTHKLTT